MLEAENLFRQHILETGRRFWTYILSLTHLMKVSPSSDDDYLCIAGVAQICCQLPLSWPVPAHIEEDLYDDEYYNNSVGGKICLE